MGGIGRMVRPSKDKWENGGCLIDKKYIIHDINVPFIYLFHNSNILPNRTRVIDLSKFDQIFIFGDSILDNMFGTFHESSLFSQRNVVVKGNAGGVSGGIDANGTITMNEALEKFD